MKKKTLALLLSCAVMVGVAVGGSLAWLTASVDEVTNTFTDSDINITLTEADTDQTTDGIQHDFKMIPGHIIDKDPVVTVVDNSEDCWLFVKVTESTTPALSAYIDYDIAAGWEPVDGVDGVYARKVFKDDATKAFSILAYEQVNGKVKVLDTVNKTLMDAIDEPGEAKPTLAFDACAVQLHKNANEDFTKALAYQQTDWYLSSVTP